MRRVGSSQIYVFKVSLKGAPRIWRTVALRGNHTLDDLHRVIYQAFDRYDEHLYSFYFPKPRRADTKRGPAADEYTHPYAYEEAPLLSETLPRDAAMTPLASLGLRVGQRFDYVFDFGDSWEHEITVEEISGPVGRARYPRIIEKRGGSPPQYPDVG